jgi:hypothetical protein
MCNAPATSDEHVPPKCFFPEHLQGKRLLTVPACEKHNSGNATDVEYVRGILCVQYGTNATGEQVFEKSKNTWDHSPKLFDRSFSGMGSAEVMDDDKTEEIGVFKADLPRVKKVVEAIAHAVYYLENGRSWPGKFEIFCAFHSEKSLRGLPDGSEAQGNFLANRPYATRQTLHPDVFELRVHESERELIYAMRFYGGPWIYARRRGAIITAVAQPLLTRI